MVDIRKYGIKPFGQTPDERQLEHLKLGKKAFFHFGINTFTDAEWGDGSEAAAAFNPTDCDVEQWIIAVKEAGFKMAILTVKHHDGFCLWPSAYTEQSVKNSPYKNGKGDIVREFTDACKKHGILAGLYCSPWDRHSPYWGKPEYSDYYAKQLTELMTNYGELHEVWWDGAGSQETEYRWNEWADIIHKYQPKALIFGSLGATPYVNLHWVGNERGVAGETHYASINAYDIEVENTKNMNTGCLGGDSYIPSECDTSIRPGWFYHEGQDNAVKTVSSLDKLWFESVGRNSIMLLNFPPDRRGRVHDRDAENAYLSNLSIEKMLSVDLAKGAKVSADSCMSDGLCAQNLVDGQDDTFYAAAEDKKTAVIDIKLDGKKRFNVFKLGELVEAGERIAAFRLEQIDGEGNAKLLCEGTSVGYCRALLFPETEADHLRLTVTEAAAAPILRTLSLYYYEKPVDKIAEGKLANLMDSAYSRVEYAPDGKSAKLFFGGVYPFDRITFLPNGNDHYTVEVFNGSSFDKVDEGETQRKVLVTVDLPEIEEGSYMIRITSGGGFNGGNYFFVGMK